jgi:hypothetical protein
MLEGSIRVSNAGFHNAGRHLPVQVTQNSGRTSEIVCRIAGIHGMDVIIRPDYAGGLVPTAFVAIGSSIDAQRQSALCHHRTDLVTRDPKVPKKIEV